MDDLWNILTEPEDKLEVVRWDQEKIASGLFIFAFQ